MFLLVFLIMISMIAAGCQRGDGALAGQAIGAGGAIVFADKNLESLIKQDLVKQKILTSTAAKLTEPKALQVTAFSENIFVNKGIVSLEGMQYFKSLTSLTMSNNKIMNLGPLSSLKKLKSLSLSINLISSVAPLVGLAALNTLLLSNNKITDVSPLKLLPALTTLHITGNPLPVSCGTDTVFGSKAAIAAFIQKCGEVCSIGKPGFCLTQDACTAVSAFWNVVDSKCYAQCPAGTVVSGLTCIKTCTPGLTSDLKCVKTGSSFYSVQGQQAADCSVSFNQNPDYGQPGVTWCGINSGYNSDSCVDGKGCCKNTVKSSYCVGTQPHNSTEDSCNPGVTKDLLMPECSLQTDSLLGEPEPKTCGVKNGKATCGLACTPNEVIVKCGASSNAKYQCNSNGVGYEWVGSATSCPTGTTCDMVKKLCVKKACPVPGNGSEKDCV